MAGTKGHSGGAREGSGPKPNTLSDELKIAIEAATSTGDRSAIFSMLADAAKGGDVHAARLYLSYAYGRPPSGDDLAVQDRVNKIVSEFFQRLAQHYGEGKAREILAVLAGHPLDSGSSPDPATDEPPRPP